MLTAIHLPIIYVNITDNLLWLNCFFPPLELVLIQLDYNSQVALGKKKLVFLLLQVYCHYLQTAFILH